MEKLKIGKLSSQNLIYKINFTFLDVTDAIPVSWKRNILDDKGNSTNFCIFDCHFMKKIHINVINRSNKELFAMQQYCGKSK